MYPWRSGELTQNESFKFFPLFWSHKRFITFGSAHQKFPAYFCRAEHFPKSLQKHQGCNFGCGFLTILAYWLTIKPSALVLLGSILYNNISGFIFLKNWWCWHTLTHYTVQTKEIVSSPISTSRSCTSRGVLPWNIYLEFVNKCQLMVFLKYFRCIGT